MTSLNYIKQIPLLRSQYEQLLNEYLVESWKLINQNVVVEFYKELCIKIPEAKSLQIQTLINKSSHPNDNKKNILYRLSCINQNKDRIANLTIVINELWGKIETLYKSVDEKFLPKLSALSKKIYEIDHKNDKLDKIIKTYENIVQNYNDMGDIKAQVMAIGDNETRENVIELYNSTKNILRCNIMLN
jgi:hypothetical protein